MRVYSREHACGFRLTREAWGELSNFHPLGRADRGRPLPVRYERGPAPGGEGRRADGRPAANRRDADAAGGDRHRPNAQSRHRPRLERAARRCDALGAADEARGEPGRDRRGVGRDRRARDRRCLDPRPVVGHATGGGPLRGPQRARAAVELRYWLRENDPPVLIRAVFVHRSAISAACQASVQIHPGAPHVSQSRSYVVRS